MKNPNTDQHKCSLQNFSLTGILEIQLSNFSPPLCMTMPQIVQMTSESFPVYSAMQKSQTHTKTCCKDDFKYNEIKYLYLKEKYYNLQ